MKSKLLLLVGWPDAVFSIRSKMRWPHCRLLAVEDGAAIDVHVVFHAPVRRRVRRKLDRGGGLADRGGVGGGSSQGHTGARLRPYSQRLLAPHRPQGGGASLWIERSRHPGLEEEQALPEGPLADLADQFTADGLMRAHAASPAEVPWVEVSLLE
jgi:hypothetical protein